MASALKENGYFYVDVNEDVTANILSHFKFSREFFSQNFQFKSQFSLAGTRRTYGYKYLPSVEKEYWKVRKISCQKWPSEEWKKICYNLADKLRKITAECLFILLREIGYSEEVIYKCLNQHDRFKSSEKISHNGNDEDTVIDFFQFSTDFMETFLYYPNSRDDWTQPADIHADTGMLTIIPCIHRIPGSLQIFDFSRNSWVSIEENGLPKDSQQMRCVIISGDILSRMSNNYYLATQHRVVMPPHSTERVSMIYEILPYPEWIIDCNSNLDQKK